VRTGGCFLIAALLLTTCATPPAAEQTAAPAPRIDCTTDPALTPQDLEAGTLLRTTVEAGPLFGTAAAGTPAASCRIGSDAGAVTLDYTFGNGAAMRVRRDARIEYTSQEVRPAAPPTENAVAILTRTERSSFAPDGCGMDWAKPETAAATDEPASSDTIYRGDVCNCQARIRTDASGRIVSLVFRSAC
jgi:hypothetical protein